MHSHTQLLSWFSM